ncbi:unnamed protein product [Paramecium octaurelia]|uniref:Uncharacterized protein n=1 Tax=Paramecium octaurelia TaxID=43137 RepID=A0A8S1YLD0_PAROT|nr:unnamed protein product [Paramecium octaurelia]
MPYTQFQEHIYKHLLTNQRIAIQAKKRGSKVLWKKHKYECLSRIHKQMATTTEVTINLKFETNLIQLTKTYDQIMIQILKRVYHHHFKSTSMNVCLGYINKWQQQQKQQSTQNLKPIQFNQPKHMIKQ